MSGRGRLALCATLATLLTALSLLPLAAPMGWFGEAVLLVVAQAGLGAAIRRAPLPRPVTALAQGVVALLLLTLFFVPRQAVLLFLPGPQAVARLVQLAGEGVNDVGQYAIPAPVTAGIRLLLVGGVLLVALLVDVVAVTYTSAAVAGLPLLALFSIASGLGTGGPRWLWFVLAAFGYLVLLLAEGRDRLSRWGRMFSGTPRRTAFGAAPAAHDSLDGQPSAAARTGRRIGGLALGIALLAPVVLPAMGAGLLGPAGGGDLGHGGGTITAVNPLVSLQNSLNQPDDREVLSYRTSLGTGVYLRIVTLDEFDGTAWRASDRKVAGVPGTLPAPAGLTAAVRTTPFSTSVTAATGYAQTYLPMPYPATRVQVGGSWRYEPEGRTLVGDHGQTTSGVHYQVQSLQVDPTAKQLADAPPPPAPLELEYTRVPSSLPPSVKKTAEQVTRGADNNYEKAVKLQDWFTTTGGFTYDTQVAEGSGTEAITRFLHDKRGFCVHFAFTMAAMARTLGIPARVDVGFVPGTQQSDGSWAVGLKDAHAWPELYFQGVGWTRFEPTPSRGSAPDYATGPTDTGGGADVPAPAASAAATPTGTASAAPECGSADRRTGGCPAGDDGASGGSTGGGGPGAGLPAGVAAALALLALACAPMLWRVRLRSARLSPARPASPGPSADARAADGTAADGGTPGAGVAGAVLADGTAADGERTMNAWRELVDSAWDYGLAPEASRTPRSAADRLIAGARLAPEPAAAVLRVRDAVEQALYARRPGPAPEVPDDVRLVLRALAGQASRPARLRALLAPRSAARVLWRWQARWSAARTAVSNAVRPLTARLTPGRPADPGA